MLLLEGFISNFTWARNYFLYVECSDFYVNQSLAGQTTSISISNGRRKNSFPRMYCWHISKTIPIQ
jgi:hypothetical protein